LDPQHTLTRKWNELQLFVIRHDFDYLIVPTFSQTLTALITRFMDEKKRVKMPAEAGSNMVREDCRWLTVTEFCQG
jgi:hypothetical protein